MAKKSNSKTILIVVVILAVVVLAFLIFGRSSTGNVVASASNCQTKYQSLSSSDRDGDGVIDLCDNAPLVKNSDQKDSDGDGVGDVIDSCAGSDKDHDGVCDNVDNCPTVYNPYTSLSTHTQEVKC